MRRIWSALFLQLIVLVSLLPEASATYRSVTRARGMQPGDVYCRWINHPVVGGGACTYMGDRRKNPDILYFFHGVDRRPEDWATAPQFQAMRDAWEKSGIGTPTVISVTFGDRWIMSGNDGNKLGRQHYFVHDIMAKLENEAGGLGPGRRLLLGESMGGHNAALLFARDARLFERAAFICPAMSTVSPFAMVWEHAAYIHRTGANAGWVLFFMDIARKLVGRPDQWSPNDALDVSRTFFNRNTPPIYVSCGDRDELGFFEGAERFARQAHERGVIVQWVPRPGGHCTNTDSAGVVKFFHTPIRRGYRR